MLRDLTVRQVGSHCHFYRPSSCSATHKESCLQWGIFRPPPTPRTSGRFQVPKSYLLVGLSKPESRRRLFQRMSCAPSCGCGWERRSDMEPHRLR